MRVRPAKESDLEFVRLTRNAGRKHFTRDNREVSPEDQELWWKTGAFDLDIFETEDGEPVGYALLTVREFRGAPREFISLAVAPEHQGKGWGTEIYRHYRHQLAEIRADNHASRRAAEKAGYQQIAVTLDGKVVMYSS